MIDWERRVLLRHYLEQGEPIARLAKRLRIGRRTIHRLIAAGQLERDLDVGRVEYKPRPPVVRKLDAYRPVIQERLRQYPQLSSVRLMEEIHAAGYTGGYTQVKEYVRSVRPHEIVFLGPPGVGKSHLAISPAIAAESGRRVYYGTLAELIRSLEEAQAADKLMPRMKTLTYPSLLVVDEIGYLPISRTDAMLFFQLMSRRYERASTVLTSNKSFEEWGDIFGDEVMAAALIDRLLHHCHIVNVRGNSFRMRHHASITRATEPEGPRGSAPTHSG